VGLNGASTALRQSIGPCPLSKSLHPAEQRRPVDPVENLGTTLRGFAILRIDAVDSCGQPAMSLQSGSTNYE
jgi:hypothetical protein